MAEHQQKVASNERKFQKLAKHLPGELSRVITAKLAEGPRSKLHLTLTVGKAYAEADEPAIRSTARQAITAAQQQFGIKIELKLQFDPNLQPRKVAAAAPDGADLPMAKIIELDVDDSGVCDVAVIQNGDDKK